MLRCARSRASKKGANMEVNEAITRIAALEAERDEQAVAASRAQEEAMNLRGVVEALQSQLDGCQRARERLAADCRVIATALREEAEEREWCDEYEGFITKVNPTLSQAWLQAPERNFTWTFVVSIEGRSRSDEKTVRAALEETLSQAGDYCQGDITVDDVQVVVR